MADIKVSELTEDTLPTSDDLIMIVNDPLITPANRKVKLENLSKALVPIYIPWDLDVATPLNGVYRVRHSTQNFLSNSGFEHWLEGINVAPSKWYLQGDATVSRSATAASGSYSAQIIFGVANTGELYGIVAVASVVDYTYSAYVQRIAGSGNARLVAQRNDAPYTEFVSVPLPTGAGWNLVTLAVKPTVDCLMRFSIKSADGVTSTWLIDECLFQESKAIATAWQPAFIDDTFSRDVFGLNDFRGGIKVNSELLKATIENGGVNEISVAGLSGLLADDQHVLDSEVLAVAAPLAHASGHQDTGADEINVAGLSGVLADDQHVIDSEVLAVAEDKTKKDAVSGYAGLNASSRTTKGVDTTDDIIIDLATKGLVLKDTQATPHYWRVTISVAGAIVTTDLGTVKP